MKLVLIFILLMTATAMLWFRFAPTSPEAWHVDPTTAKDPGTSGALVEARFAAQPKAVVDAFETVAESTARTRRIAGDPASGFLTYVSRSLVWGFPDYTSIKVVPSDGDGTRVVLYARQRFGGYDHGVNQSRVDDWLAQVEARLGS